MQDKLMKSLQAIAIAGTLAFAGGCTLTGAQEAADTVNPLDEVREIANEALRTANTAAYNAATAKDMAFSAQETADTALEAAASAQAYSDANSRKMNVMFHDSMKGK
tara:strand:- start:514 stop:834 length:321 start_codon:yes stop_codon:yes gene_type:complete